MNSNEKFCMMHGKTCHGECEDPNVDNGMMTKIWGPPGWLFLHCVTFGYPYIIMMNKEEHLIRRERTRRYFRDLGYVLPCKYCRMSYQDFMKEIPIEKYLASRRDLTYWFYMMHNKVNNKLGVPDCRIPSYEEVKDKFESFRAKCNKTTNSEKEKNTTKGCVKPADGTTKRCFLQVVNCKNGDVTRRENTYYTENTNDYVLIKREYLIIVCIILALIIIGTPCYIFRKQIVKFLKKKKR